ncbi:hybrid sensor histidine kinase/response regulator [Crocosphaera sp. XPORK-15E]|uniref:ATP-binding response regulator n=1 Tax=Crocosphaera sp. XPORK-15E TaxID=3110247 RepID=UPI002B1FD2BE|nr:hybrid sensor histidine kinase/response regulator [Crocosphaera sp. XPORK-15E]MEA5535841.1 hybrid sensor histidine kinase/response regulator [Crocosphaera sp. XPORK-15E]
MLTLQHFLHSVPVCHLPVTFPYLISQFQSGQHDTVVLVNEYDIPLGLISSRQLMLKLLENPQIKPDQQDGTSWNLSQSQTSFPSWDWENCLSPLVLIPSRLSLAEFFPYIQDQGTTETSQPVYGLIDERGKFLGLLDSWQILKTLLAQKNSVGSESSSVHSAKQLLKGLLEELPLPVMLQTEQGEIIQQNRTWRQEIGALIPPDDASACPLPSEKMLSLQTQTSTVNMSGGHQEFYSEFVAQKSVTVTHASCSHWFKSIPQGLTEFESSPYREEIYPPFSPDYQTIPSQPVSHKERVWQFIKCPLTTDKFSSTISIVVATDVTSQQQLCQELVAKNADLVQLNRMKDEFLACISHELKSPLTAVVGLSSLLQEQKVGELNTRQVHYAELIYRSGRQLMTLVNDLLDLTRLETGQLQLSLVPLTIKNLCERAYYSIQEKYQAKTDTPLSFSLDIEPGLNILIADELRIHQMLVHLLDNARKFTQTGGKFGLKVNRWEDWIAFTIWDTGIGIPEECQHLIFQKFQQLENPLTRQFEGTGLGLVLTQRLARAHGGEVSFVSKAGQGSEFTLLLPPSPGQQETKPNTQSCNPLVLIVEAIPQAIEDLLGKLTQLGYRVVIARTGTEAVEKARQLRPYAVFLNPLLPLLSGWDVLSLLKSDPQTQDIRIFVTATQGNQSLREHNYADGFLPIPADLLTLENILERVQPTTIPQTRALTILRLNPNFPQGQEQTMTLGARLEWTLIAQLSQFNHRILEADDLEQAEMLINVWDIDVVVLDGQFLENPTSYLQSLSQQTELAALPLVILDVTTTEAANQIENLSVFPCLIPENKHQIQQLWEVISIATQSQV